MSKILRANIRGLWWDKYKEESEWPAFVVGIVYWCFHISVFPADPNSQPTSSRAERSRSYSLIWEPCHTFQGSKGEIVPESGNTLLKKWVVISKWIGCCQRAFSGGLVVRNPPVNAGGARDAGSIPESGRSPGEENGKPFQYYCLGNPMGRGGLAGYSLWLARVGHNLGVKSWKQVEFPQKQTLKQEFKCKSLIGEMILGRSSVGKRR